jgi:hypothetical protein
MVAAVVCIPSGIIEEKEEEGCCEGIGKVLRRIMCMPRKKVSQHFESMNSSS